MFNNNKLSLIEMLNKQNEDLKRMDEQMTSLIEKETKQHEKLKLINEKIALLKEKVVEQNKKIQLKCEQKETLPIKTKVEDLDPKLSEGLLHLKKIQNNDHHNNSLKNFCGSNQYDHSGKCVMQIKITNYNLWDPLANVNSANKHHTTT